MGQSGGQKKSSREINHEAAQQKSKSSAAILRVAKKLSSY
jgi:hypothetical protein